MDSDRGNIGEAFDRLLEQVEREIQHVNRTAVAAFESAQKAQVDQAWQRASELRAFKEKVLALRGEWERPATPRRAASTTGGIGLSEPVTPKRRFLGRSEPGQTTPHAEFYRPILLCLEQMGGSAHASRVLEAVERAMNGVFQDADYGTVPSDPNRPRWKSTAYYARYVMVQQGLLRNDSSTGMWELTNEGRSFLSKGPTPRQEEQSYPTERSVFRRVRPGLRTRESAYYQPILEALVARGGSADLNYVLSHVERAMRSIFTAVDYRPLSSDPDMPRWRNGAQWARFAMVKQGLLKPKSRRGVWEITEQGRETLARLISSAAAVTSAPAPDQTGYTSQPTQQEPGSDVTTNGNLPAPPTSFDQTVPDGQLTPLDAYYRPILSSLLALGGSARLADVRERVAYLMKDTFNKTDLTMHPNNSNMALWRSVYYRAAGNLLQQGMIMNGGVDDSWQITDKGREYLSSIGHY